MICFGVVDLLASGAFTRNEKLIRLKIDAHSTVKNGRRIAEGTRKKSIGIYSLVLFVFSDFIDF